MSQLLLVRPVFGVKRLALLVVVMIIMMHPFCVFDFTDVTQVCLHQSPTSGPPYTHWWEANAGLAISSQLDFGQDVLDLKIDRPEYFLCVSLQSHKRQRAS